MRKKIAMSQTSAALGRIQPSATLAMSARVNALKAEGVERPAQISYVYATTAEVGHLVRARDMVRARVRAKY